MAEACLRFFSRCETRTFSTYERINSRSNATSSQLHSVRVCESVHVTLVLRVEDRLCTPPTAARLLRQVHSSSRRVSGEDQLPEEKPCHEEAHESFAGEWYTACFSHASEKKKLDIFIRSHSTSMHPSQRKGKRLSPGAELGSGRILLHTTYG